MDGRERNFRTVILGRIWTDACLASLCGFEGLRARPTTYNKDLVSSTGRITSHHHICRPKKWLNIDHFMGSLCLDRPVLLNTHSYLIRMEQNVDADGPCPLSLLIPTVGFLLPKNRRSLETQSAIRKPGSTPLF